ncbi:tyrosine-type recombinase/integrase [Corallincola platygyrae]|uniref:Tyrosine-type recombinase/integrase n=1 Tax=Corallincola platygyrae TaxID=1193278 RepID=A0ABW4XIS9_9GAMM
MTPSDIKKLSTLITERLEQQLCSSEIVPILTLSCIIHGGLFGRIEFVEGAVRSLIAAKKSIRWCGPFAWIEYEVPAEATGKLCNHLSPDGTPVCQARFYIDALSLLLLAQLRKNGTNTPTQLDSIWLEAQRWIHQSLGISPAYGVFTEAVRQFWRLEAPEAMTPTLEKACSGGWPSVGLNHERNWSYLTGMSKTLDNHWIMDPEEHSDDHWSPPELNQPTPIKRDIHNIRYAIKHLPRNQRYLAANALTNALQRLETDAGKTLAQWLAIKLQHNRSHLQINVKTACCYATQLLPVFDELHKELLTGQNEGTPLPDALKDEVSIWLAKQKYENSTTPTRLSLLIEDMFQNRPNSPPRISMVNAALVSPLALSNLYREGSPLFSIIEWNTLIDVQYETGLRISEISHLTRSDSVPRSDRTLDIHIHGTDKKSANALRVVNTSSDNALLVRQILALTEFGNSPGLCSTNNGQRFAASRLSKHVSSVVQTALNDAGAGSHTIRHTYADDSFISNYAPALAEFMGRYRSIQTPLSNANKDQRFQQVSVSLGHTNESVTFASYIHSVDLVRWYVGRKLLPPVSAKLIRECTGVERVRLSRHLLKDPCTGQVLQPTNPNAWREHCLTTLGAEQVGLVLKPAVALPIQATTSESPSSRMAGVLGAFLNLHSENLPRLLCLERESVKLRIRELNKTSSDLFRGNQRSRLPLPISMPEKLTLRHVLLNLANLNQSELARIRRATPLIQSSFSSRDKPSGFKFATVRDAERAIRALTLLTSSDKFQAALTESNGKQGTSRKNWIQSTLMSSLLAPVAGSPKQRCLLKILFKHGNRASVLNRTLLVFLSLLVDSTGK